MSSDIKLKFVPVIIGGQKAFKITDQNGGNYDHIASAIEFNKLSGNFYEAKLSFFFEDESEELPDSYSVDAASYPREQN